MPKKILFIENDPAFGAAVSEALEATGFEVRLTGDGKEGLELARDWAPDAIVLCVELPGMSGYLVCQKLKKDDALRSVPLVLTSAEATEETFEKHRTLKARADEYLLKPYPPEALVERLADLIGLPERAPAAETGGDEELVSLEEEMGLEASAEGSPDEEIPGLDLQSLPDEPATGVGLGAGEDDDLRLLDDAFEGLSAPPAPADAAAALDEIAGGKPVAVDEVDAAAASLPDEDEGAARRELGGLDDDAEAVLGALGAEDELIEPGPPARPVRGASADLLRAAGIKVLGGPPAAPPDRGGAAELAEALERARADLAGRDAELRDLSRRADVAEAELERARTRAEAATAQVRKAEAEAKAGRDEARRAAEQAKAAEAESADLRRRLADAERRADVAEGEARRRGEEAAAAAEAAARVEGLEREADELRTELLVARGEAEGARGEVEKRTTELRKRLAELEAASAKNEERVVKAYQKIKADEKVRDKARKALAVATQLLEEGLPAESPAERERRATSPVGGRE
jgi:CheY-like chemotaxis protein